MLGLFDALDSLEVQGVTDVLLKREGFRITLFETALGFWFSEKRTPLS